MIISIDGHRFDTTRAKAHFRLDYWDGSNRHTGDLYLSSKGTWYANTPSQWSNGHRWETIAPSEALDRWGQHYLDEDERREIIRLANLDTE